MLIMGCFKTTIPSTIMIIGNSAFSNCPNLTSIIIPKGVTSIGGYAFSDCHNLTKVTIPKSVTIIWAMAFIDSPKLTIYCEASSKPLGWDCDWNCDNRPVIWGYKGK